MSKIEKLVDDLSGLTVLEASELAKLLEDKWGVSAAAPIAAMAVRPWTFGARQLHCPSCTYRMPLRSLRQGFTLRNGRV